MKVAMTLSKKRFLKIIFYYFIFIFSTFVQVRRNPNEAPLSPTHYPKGSTPEHAPPSAEQAERYIYDRIRPLSQVSEEAINTNKVEATYLPMDHFKFKK